MTDVRLFATNDGGDIEFRNGQAVMSDGLETAAYLSLFGGNEEDSALQATEHLQWWGNLDVTDPAAQYRSRFQHLVQSLPATPANLKRLEDAALADLAWFEDEVATTVQVVARMPKLNWVDLAISIFDASGKKLLGTTFGVQWGST